MYTKLDLNNWERVEQYKLFKTYDLPFFNICSEVDVTALVAATQSSGHSFFISMLYASTFVANQIKEFKYRIKDDGVVVFDSIDAGSTLLNDDETFSFGYFEYHQKFKVFHQLAKAQIDQIRSGEKKFEPRDEVIDLIHYSSIPWITFTGFAHARKLNPEDSIPKIVFGQFHKQADRYVIPVSVEVHHALMDGIHVGKYFNQLQRLLNDVVFMNNQSGCC